MVGCTRSSPVGPTARTLAGVSLVRPHQRITVPLSKDGDYVYRLVTVGSWSAPDDPVAVYGDTCAAPEPPLSEVEKSWLNRRTGQ